MTIDLIRSDILTALALDGVDISGGWGSAPVKAALALQGWIEDGVRRVGDALDPAYRDELAKAIESLREMVRAAKADWRTVDADAMARAKEQLDRLSVKLHETSISQSLRGLGTGG